MIPTDDQQHDAFDYPPEVSRRLVKELRGALKLKQEHFAELVSLHPMTVSKLENERAGMDEQLRRKLLMLRDIAAVPGVVDVLRYVLQAHNGDDALMLAQVIHKVTA